MPFFCSGPALTSTEISSHYTYHQESRAKVFYFEIRSHANLTLTSYFFEAKQVPPGMTFPFAPF